MINRGLILAAQKLVIREIFKLGSIYKQEFYLELYKYTSNTGADD